MTSVTWTSGCRRRRNISGCMTRADFDTAQVAESSGGDALGNGQACLDCHRSGPNEPNTLHSRSMNTVIDEVRNSLSRFMHLSAFSYLQARDRDATNLVMSRRRKIHVQQSLDLNAKRDRCGGKRGGKRKGAGRPAKRPHRPSERHVTRLRFNRLTVLHVTLRLVDNYGSLRNRESFLAIRRATQAVLDRADFRIVHASPETDHLHLVVEAESNDALTRGMQAFQISAAQHLNRVKSRRLDRRVRGKVFADRYHARVVGSPTQARNTLNYVLNNWRRHLHDDANAPAAHRFWDVDYMSSAVSFAGWKELETRPFQYDVIPELRLCVSPPHSWLLAAGWRKAGPISMYAVPGPR